MWRTKTYRRGKKFPVYFALVFAVVAGAATVLTVVTPQSAIADGCSGGNC